MAKEDRSVRCSFCGKKQDQVERLIAGQGAYICNECVELCVSILGDDYVPEEQTAPTREHVMQERLPKPAEMRAVLDQYIVG